MNKKRITKLLIGLGLFILLLHPLLPLTYYGINLPQTQSLGILIFSIITFDRFDLLWLDKKRSALKMHFNYLNI